MKSTVQYSTSAFSPIMILSDFGCDVTCKLSQENSQRFPHQLARVRLWFHSVTACRCVRRGVVGHSPPQGSCQCGVSRKYYPSPETTSLIKNIYPTYSALACQVFVVWCEEFGLSFVKLSHYACRLYLRKIPKGSLNNIPKTAPFPDQIQPVKIFQL